ncbi:ADP-forming succinate--CoA ligase subunit beta [Chlamydiifrater phoenicopteri]|uniref:ADP-forming succinate--CoA ligase subunit beta n=1 Tax=Chlamydiifrater phoenicopteri TaxID=2681469 RepID=UPI001BCE0A8F|nr:ADP-forming succinate--CoA ligase subunit beta [Chlamydiifrater phoenicopteri]
MNLHEYQAKDLLSRYEMPIPPYEVISSGEEITSALSKLRVDEGIAKIQVHAGGRGKNGGVKVFKGKDSADSVINELLGMKFSNNQTGGKELLVEKVLVSPLVDIDSEYYVAVTMDRRRQCPSLIISPSGGMDIEEVLISSPQKMLSEPVTYYGKIYDYRLRKCVKFLGWTGKIAEQGILLMKQLVRAFMENDASLVEINPLVITKSGEFFVLDAKISIDDNALYRHPILSSCYDPSQENIRDVMAKQIGLSYIAMDGNIGCLVNGAGLAMSTLDILQFYGGNAANFLDVGGGASENQVKEAISLTLSDTNVQVLFVNIFGGIMDCSIIASGLVSALGQGETSRIPLVLRMEGTNVEKGKELLKQAGLEFYSVDSMDEGAQLAVKLSQKVIE